MSSATTTPSYVATVGINYPSAIDGKERRVEAGDPIPDLPPTALKNELAAGHVVDANALVEAVTAPADTTPTAPDAPAVEPAPATVDPAVAPAADQTVTDTSGGVN